MQELLKELHRNLFNSHSDNYDREASGDPASTRWGRVRNWCKALLLQRSALTRSDIDALFSAIQPFVWFFHRFEQLYDALADSESKLLLVQVVAFRILGPEKVKLPLNNEEFWRQRIVLHGLEGTESIEAGRYRLRITDLNWIGYPIRMYGVVPGTQNVFLLKQYEYKSGSVHIKAESGDVVLDGGGCWGDTALYFAHEVGALGKVHVFEFIPSNLTVLRENVKLNPSLKKQINIVNRPLWSTSDVPLHFKDLGPSSRGSVDGNNSEEAAASYPTITIDDFVQREGLTKVDFIKLDIEAAEVEALRGAEQTLKKFRPKLAISVYHSISDFVDVFEYIASLNEGYRFYLGHYTIHWYETILFAMSDSTP